jgi:hypothetical protein
MRDFWTLIGPNWNELTPLCKSGALILGRLSQLGCTGGPIFHSRLVFFGALTVPVGLAPIHPFPSPLCGNTFGDGNTFDAPGNTFCSLIA